MADSDAAGYCTNCGEALEPEWRACGQCGTTLQPAPTASDPAESYAHITGDVYWSTSWVYLLVEVPGLALMVLPERWIAEAFQDVFRWWLQQDPQSFLWFAQNFRMVGLALLVAGLAGRITINPDAD